MAFNVESLPNYVEVNKDELFVKGVAGAKTLDYVELMANVKGQAALNYLNSTVVLADGSECGWNPQGGDTFSQRTITVKPVTVQKEFCWKDLKDKFMNHQLNFAAGREKLPFEQKLVESNTNEIQKAVEKLVWQGDTGLTMNGYIDLIKAESTAVKVTYNAEDIVATVDEVVEKMSVEMLEKGATVFMSYTNFRKYVKALNENCCANRAIIDAAAGEVIYAGDSRVKIVPIIGLEGKENIVAATADALVYATDIEGSESIYRMFYDVKESKFLFEVLFNAGMAVKFPNEVVIAQ